jgi:hypothetical protein
MSHVEKHPLYRFTRLESRAIHAEILDMKFAWFLYSNDVVSGPFSTEDVQNKIVTGILGANTHIWWKGQREWIPISTWLNQVDRIVQNAQDRAQKPVWYVDAGKSPTGPLTEKELIDHLKNTPSLARVRLWAVGMEKWTSLFELSEVMELLGLSRRENERAPLMGTVAVSRSNDDPQGFVLRAASISVAGMGVQGRHDLRCGDSISMIVKSAEIPSSLSLRGEIAYVTANGYAGIRFETVHAEAHSLIVDYVKRFNADEEKTAGAA